MLEPQQTLQNRYWLEQCLSQNSSRQTWLAQDLQRHQVVVVKLLAFSPQMQWEELKLFEREAQVLRQLSHPRIPVYVDYFTIDPDQGLAWFALVQDFIAGQSLQQCLESGQRFTVAQIQAIAAQVLDILIYLHGLDPPVLHRDIKPSNLIWGADQQVYLVDFGAVQNQAATTGVTFTIVGTTGYAPLEQFWGRAEPASDLYALGATLIYLLTGTAPADLPQRNLRIQFADRVSLDTNLVHWIQSLTEPDLQHRYPSAQAALQDLQAGRSRSECLQPIPAPSRDRIRLAKSPYQVTVTVSACPRYVWRDSLEFLGKLLLVGGSSFTSLSLILAMCILIPLGLLALLGAVSHNSGLIVVFLVMVVIIAILSHCLRGISDELLQFPDGWLRSPLLSLRAYRLNLTLQGAILEWYWGKVCVRRRRILSPTLELVKLIHPRGVALQRRESRDLVTNWSEESILLANLTEPIGYHLSPLEQEWLIQELTDWLQQAGLIDNSP